MENKKWETIEYIKANGEVPVDDFLDSLPPKEEAKVLRTIGLLETFGPALPGPHKKSLGDGLFELRTKISSNIFRITFFHFQDNKFVLLHGFRKKTTKTPPAEIAKAKKYRDDFLKQRSERK